MTTQKKTSRMIYFLYLVLKRICYQKIVSEGVSQLRFAAY